MPTTTNSPVASTKPPKVPKLPGAVKTPKLPGQSRFPWLGGKSMEPRTRGSMRAHRAKQLETSAYPGISIKSLLPH